MFKNKKKDKGFTLIELLVTIAVLSILSIVTGVIVVNVLDSSKDNSTKVTYANIQTAAINYTTEFKNNSDLWLEEKENNIPTGNEYTCTTIQQIINKGFLKNNLVEADTGNKIDNNTMIKVVRDSNKVLSSNIEKNSPDCDTTKPELTISVDGPSVKIGDKIWYYDSEEKKTTIKITPIVLGTAGVREYQFYVNGNNVFFIEISEKSGYTINLSSNLDNVNNYGENVKVCGKILNTNDIESTENCITINVDFTTPEKPTLTASDNITSGSWHKNKFNLNISGGASPSGINYQYNTDGGNSYIKLTENKIADISSSDTTYYVKTCNTVGKCSSEISVYQAKVDSEIPSIISFTKNTEETARELTLTASIKDELSGIVKYKITTENSYTENNWTKINPTNDILTITKDITSNNNYYVWVEDEVGNYNKSNLNITNIDREGPVYKSGGNVSLGSITTAKFDDVSTPVTVYYQVTTTSSQPSSDSFTQTTRTFSTDCGKTYYAWAKAVDRLGNYTIKQLGSISSNACCYAGDFEDYDCASDGFIRQRRYNACTYEWEYNEPKTKTCESTSTCYDWGDCQSSGYKYRECYYYEGGSQIFYEESTTCEYETQYRTYCSNTIDCGYALIPYLTSGCSLLDQEATGPMAQCYQYTYFCYCPVN